MYKYKDILNQRFGSLTVVSKSANRRGKERAIRWNCSCDCGSNLEVSGSALRAGQIISCGCSRRDINKRKATSENHKIDGFTRAVNRVLLNYKQGAIKRGYSWDLTREDFINLTQKVCVYCGSPPNKLVDVSVLEEKRVFSFNGIDRIDNSLGYTTTNTVACCSACNYMKRSFTVEQFITHIQQILVHQSKI